MRIDCTECRMYKTEHCDDCLVTALLHPPDVPVDIEDEIDSSLRVLSGAGLIPVLKFRPRDDGDETQTSEAGPEARAG